MERTHLSIVAVATLSLLYASTARAQGHSQGNGHGHNGGVSAGAGSGSPLPASDLATRNFGVWLDDASIVAPGEGWMNISFGYFKADAFGEFDMPVTDAGVGLTRQLQFGFSVPVYNVSMPGTVATHGLGDLFIHAKYQLRSADASKHRTGIAILPVIEISNDVPADGHRSVHFGVPIAFEVQHTGWRMYSAIGFFSRGSLFASGALERAITSRVTATGSLTHSYSLRNDITPSALSRTRTDVTGAVSYKLRDSYSVFGAIGRTISPHDPTSTNLSISGGITVGLGAGD
jgi:hypothetical protein